MSTITLYSGKINQMPSLINDARKAVKEYKSDLKSLKSKVLTIDGSVCNVDDVINSIKSSSQTQEDKIDALDKLKKDVNEFVSEVVVSTVTPPTLSIRAKMIFTMSTIT